MSESHSQKEPASQFNLSRVLALGALICAGESIFFLPFVLPRVFRSTILDVFGLTNTQLGAAFSAYGLVAVVAYALGGPLADFLRPRKLIAIALVSTAMGGIVLWQIPALSTLKSLYAYWGFTTIALFWSALMRATRQWGGSLAQGSAFGLLEGGRGLLAAVTGSCVLAIYASLLPVDVESASLEVRASALRQVILILTGITCAAAVMTWFLLPKGNVGEENVGEGNAVEGNAVEENSSLSDASLDGPAERSAPPKWSLHGTLQVACMPVVWLQALIIICAYVGFKATDDFALYAKEVLHLNEVEAARVGTYSLWVRPLAAIAAGFLADRFGCGKMMVVSFALLAAGSAVLASDVLTASLFIPFVATVVSASLGIYALRGLYFGVMEEGQVPLAYTGSAVGLVSVIGYTPDIFMGPLMGVLLDGSPGASGHRHVFIAVALFAIAGLIASLLYISLTRSKKRSIQAA